MPEPIQEPPSEPTQELTFDLEAESDNKSLLGTVTSWLGY